MNDIFLKLKEVEENKIKTIVRKRGIECLIKPVVNTNQTIDDYDIFYDENVEILKEKQEEKLNYTYGEPFNTKVLFLTNENQFFEVIDESYQHNVNDDILRCLVDYDEMLQVGSIIEIFDNIRYRIAKIEKYRGLSDVYYYHLIRT